MFHLLLLASFLAQDKPPEKCSVSGTVVDSITGQPLGKVDLALVASERFQTAVTTTDAKGQFRVVDRTSTSAILPVSIPNWSESTARISYFRRSTIRLISTSPIKFVGGPRPAHPHLRRA